MFNFKNLFRNPDDQLDDLIDRIKNGTEEQPNMNYVTPVEVPGQKNPTHALFTVGINDDGRTQLTVGHPTSITLTLNDAAVAQMIKLLAANIDTNYVVTVKEI